MFILENCTPYDLGPLPAFSHNAGSNVRWKVKVLDRHVAMCPICHHCLQQVFQLSTLNHINKYKSSQSLLEILEMHTSLCLYG